MAWSTAGDEVPRNLLGVRVIVSDWAEAGEVLVLGTFDAPPDWGAMSKEERIAYAVAHGATLIVRNLDTLKDVR